MHRLPDLGPRGEGWLALQIILFWAIVASGVIEPAWSGPLAAATAVLGAVLIAVGGVLAFLGLRDLGASLTALPRPKDDGRLVETGVYGRARHPIYGGLVVAAIGWALLRASLAGLVLSAVLLGFFFLKSTREEAWLVDRFPDYPTYRRRTRRFVPFVA